MSEKIDVAEIKQKLRGFASERDWEQFHSPKNLAMALSGECGELIELFQWLTEKQSTELKGSEAVADELADILLYSIRLADKLEINLASALDNKMTKNAQKYPVEKAKGHAKKYTEL